MLAQPNDFFELVERLGGWAVVIWIVFWLTRKWENHMTQLVEELSILNKCLRAHMDAQDQRMSRLEDSIKTIKERI